MPFADILRQHIANVGNPVAPEIYADDVSMDFPYAPKHHTGRLEGKEAVLRFLTNIGVFFHDVKLGEPTIHLTQDPNVAVVEVEGKAVSVDTGKPYEQNYVSIVTLRDGEIAHIREYYNPVRVLVSIGEIEEPGGEA